MHEDIGVNSMRGWARQSGFCVQQMLGSLCQSCQSHTTLALLAHVGQTSRTVDEHQPPNGFQQRYNSGSRMQHLQTMLVGVLVRHSTLNKEPGPLPQVYTGLLR
jgi:hypothetical protein